MQAGIYWHCRIENFDTSRITDFGISNPLEQSLATPSTMITGWVGGPNVQDRRVSLRFGSEVLATSELRSLGNGLAVFRLPTTRVESDLEIVASGAVELALAKLRIVPLPEYGGHLLPIMASVGGRSGSTLVMKVLAEHPLIVARRLHSFESRFAQALAILQDRAADTLNPVAVNSLVDAVDQRLSTPFFQEDDFFSSALFQTSFSKHLRVLVDDYYSSVAAEQKEQQPLFFAEKIMSSTSGGRLREAYGQTRVVFAFRDPRDTFLSMRAHQPSWRNLAGHDEETMLRTVCEWFRRGIASASESVDRHTVIRYEDLITAPHSTIAKMFEDIGLPVSSNQLENIVRRAFAEDEITRSHMTSENAAASVGRWKRQLPPALVSLCASEFGALLESAGYAPSP